MIIMIYKHKLRRKYMSEIKAFFPIIKKDERKFLKMISGSVDEYCSDNPDASIQDLYEHFGSPQETINSYMTTTLDSLKPYFKKVKYARFFRYISIVLIIFIMIASTFKVLKLYNDYQTLKDTTIDHYEETID